MQEIGFCFRPFLEEKDNISTVTKGSYVHYFTISYYLPFRAAISYAMWNGILGE